MRTIVSDRLLLRPWQDDDADFLLDLESGSQIVVSSGAQPTTMKTRKDALASIRRRRAIEHPIHGNWAIATANGRLVGNLLLLPIPPWAEQSFSGSNDVEIGWHVHPDARGQGYATEAADAVLRDAFGRGLPRVLAVTEPDNHASQAVCRRLGMTALGRTTRYYDTINELFEKLPS
ncbi:GNAT family N-acetyltransferase [Verrucosispora sp. FIM060022]|uniref:GNAT family N-acetyltransferase n=1 Tax=Verrucosispora sp. FIM060022 TaxID=1479020 RepID=UPI000F876A32|nr:GNAT family N-acetyltransferase [Verrucosispora sp. FIM060022]RUL90255.1 N-acetyltransferase [Verrucosispora sp. FIM060022]